MTDKPSLDELIHSGVKGMKWGVRKSEQPMNSRYSEKNRKIDKNLHGSRAVKRINNRLNKGQTLKKARNREMRRDAFQSAALVGSYYGVKAAVKYGPVLVQAIAIKAETNRGKAYASSNMGIPRTATSAPSYAKQKRGAYNITSV